MTDGSFRDTQTARDVSLIIPCYNEAQRLDIGQFRQFLREDVETRLIFVDDGSSDHTLQVLRELCSGFESSTDIVSNPRNQGKAEAVRSGILHALASPACEVVGFWDADLATPLVSVGRFLDILRNRPEIEMIFGSRVQLLGRYVKRSAARHYLGRVFATAVSVVLHLPIYDTQCGAKLFRVRPETRSIFAERFLSRWVFDVEILARYQQIFRSEGKSLADVVYEYPLESWVDVAGSKVGPADFFIALWDVLRIQQRYLR
jgi:dolichyl-phosphate beta-glucosyltransferase